VRISKTASVCLAAVAMSVAAVVPVGLLSANASTTACGSPCTSLSVEVDGTSEVLTVTSLSSGTVAMEAASTTNTGQDFTLLAQGGVQGAANAGVISNRLSWLYGAQGDLVEYEYAPGGAVTGMCLAGGVTNESVTYPDDASYVNGNSYVPNLSVTLARCGLTAQTLWIPDPNTEAENTNGYVDLINAGYEAEPDYADAPSPSGATNASPTSTLVSPFAEPAVLAYNGSKVVLAELNEIGGTVSSGQMWTGSSGPLGTQARQALEKSAAALRALGKS
jgi:hypothetical protein